MGFEVKSNTWYYHADESHLTVRLHASDPTDEKSRIVATVQVPVGEQVDVTLGPFPHPVDPAWLSVADGDGPPLYYQRLYGGLHAGHTVTWQGLDTRTPFYAMPAC